MKMYKRKVYRKRLKSVLKNHHNLHAEGNQLTKFYSIFHIIQTFLLFLLLLITHSIHLSSPPKKKKDKAEILWCITRFLHLSSFSFCHFIVAFSHYAKNVCLKANLIESAVKETKNNKEYRINIIPYYINWQGHVLYNSKAWSSKQ